MTDQSSDPQIIKGKITNALKVLSFRELRVLVQFWSPIAVRKHCLLTTLDQPFGIGVIDEGLYLYRLESEQRVFVVNEEHIEELGSSPGRVYRQKLPEWSLDVHSLSTRQCVNGYINLPVFEPSNGCCVGVIEIVTSSNYVDYSFEVREVSRALKEENLKSPNVFEDTDFYVGDERIEHELDEIFLVLKTVCDIHNLPLAQTWMISGYSSVVANSGNLIRTCSSFSKNCIGKVCMSTTDSLPFYIRDLSMWGFHEACTQQHLDKSHGVVGMSLSSRGLCFCKDVTKLSEDEYPLVPYARVNGITSCLAIYLKSIEVDIEYVMELFLSNEEDVQSLANNVVKTVKGQIKNGSRVKLGNMSSIQVIGGSPLIWNLEESLSLTEKEELPPESNEPESNGQQLLIVNEPCDVDTNITLSEKSNGQPLLEDMEEDNLHDKPSNSIDAGTGQIVVPFMEVEDSGQPIKRKRNRTVRSYKHEEVSQYFGNTMDEAAISLNVSRSTLKRICRSLGIPRWPYKSVPDKIDTHLKPDENVHGSELPLSTPALEVSSETLNITSMITHDLATLTEHGERNSTPGPHQQERTNLPDGSSQLLTTVNGKSIENTSANTVKYVTVKATYKENIVKFPFSLSDGLVKLKKLIEERFQLKPESFNLGYLDEDGDNIKICSDDDLMMMISLGAQPDIQTVIRLLVSPVEKDDYPSSNLSL
ncbi:protein NLP6-like [Rutidosis leptorrhynchoides]|uniref:protein NLP6-like n=1 Tax=Rutidosis leptorrhynchoides TaxID=125765 RepID=UPI003A99A5EC